METVVVPGKKKSVNGFSHEKQKGIKNHERAAHHHEKAAKHHHDAARYHEAGNHKKAGESTVKALGHHCFASDAQRMQNIMPLKSEPMLYQGYFTKSWFEEKP